jgi:hypothetical protein
MDAMCTPAVLCAFQYVNYSPCDISPAKQHNTTQTLLVMAISRTVACYKRNKYIRNWIKTKTLERTRVSLQITTNLILKSHRKIIRYQNYYHDGRQPDTGPYPEPPKSTLHLLSQSHKDPILPSTHRSPEWCLSFRLSHQNPVHFPLLSHGSHTSISFISSA